MKFMKLSTCTCLFAVVVFMLSCTEDAGNNNATSTSTNSATTSETAAKGSSGDRPINLGKNVEIEGRTPEEVTADIEAKLKSAGLIDNTGNTGSGIVADANTGGQTKVTGDISKPELKADANAPRKFDPNGANTLKPGPGAVKGAPPPGHGDRLIQKLTMDGNVYYAVNPCFQCPDAMVTFYNEKMEVVCTEGGIAGANTCGRDFSRAIRAKEVVSNSERLTEMPKGQ